MIMRCLETIATGQFQYSSRRTHRSSGFEPLFPHWLRTVINPIASILNDVRGGGDRIEPEVARNLTALQVNR